MSGEGGDSGSLESKFGGLNVNAKPFVPNVNAPEFVPSFGAASAPVSPSSEPEVSDSPAPAICELQEQAASSPSTPLRCKSSFEISAIPLVYDAH